MDRSFLSDAAVIAASRNFVCVRLATYEDRDEAALLRKLAPTGSGELENTVFTILSPDGKRQLVRGSRSARHSFGTAGRMAQGMNRIAGQYSATAAVDGLPAVANVRLALDVAACDSQPLVVVLARDADTRHRLEDRVRTLAWDRAFLGRFVYATAQDASELSTVLGDKPAAGVLVVEPDKFGTRGNVVSRADADATLEALAECLLSSLSKHQFVARNFRDHVRQGQQLGVFWETTVPVTDPMEQNARERGRRR